MIQKISVYTNVFKATKSCKYRVVLEKSSDGIQVKVYQDKLREEGDLIIRYNDSSIFNKFIGTFDTEQEAENFASQLRNLPNNVNSLWNSTKLSITIPQPNEYYAYLLIENLAEYYDNLKCCVVKNPKGELEIVEYLLFYNTESKVYLRKINTLSECVVANVDKEYAEKYITLHSINRR